MQAQDLKLRKLTGSIGAEVTGIDLRDLDDNSFGTLKRALLDHCVLVIRDQALDPASQVAFGRRFGEIHLTPYLPSIPGHPEILPIVNRGKEKTVTEAWHSDSTFMERPPAITMLAAQRLPETGGDTIFANQHIAYDRLSAGMKTLIEDLKAVHYASIVAGLANADGSAVRKAVHPVVRTHAETGRKALYVTAKVAQHFEDMSPEESRPLLDYLCRSAIEPDLCYRHMWRPGDVVVWDNRSAQHYAVHDHGEAERMLHRLTIVGDRPH